MKKKKPSELCIRTQMLNDTLNMCTSIHCGNAITFYKFFVEEGPILIDTAEGISYLYVKIK